MRKVGKNKISGNVQTKQGASLVCETMSEYVKYRRSGFCLCVYVQKQSGSKTLDPIAEHFLTRHF